MANVVRVKEDAVITAQKFQLTPKPGKNITNHRAAARTRERGNLQLVT